MVLLKLHPRFALYFIFIVLCVTTIDAQNPGSLNQREAYFNGSAYLRLPTTTSLKKQTALSFRTCHEGILFSQTHHEDFLKLSVDAEGVLFTAKTAGKQYEERIVGNFINNKWYTVQIQYKLGNVTITVGGQTRLIANSTYRSELLTNPSLYNEASAVLIVGQSFNGCLQEGPSLVFNNNFITNYNVEFIKCPIPMDSCIPPYTFQDSCKNEPCMRQGTCINVPSGYTCACLPRYTGKNCEIDTGDPCAKTPSVCKNGGECTDSHTGEYMCVCPPGFTGKQCDSEITIQKFCKVNNCSNGGTCIEINNVSKCVCTAGFTGPSCEVDVNECTPDSCKNGGECIDGLNTFTCNCKNTGYHGSFCEIDIDECIVLKPCNNRGICFNTYGSYLCECKSGYGGHNCEEILNECDAVICNNRGTCLAHPDGFDCVCSSGYTGEHCEIEDVRGCDPDTCPYFADCSIVRNTVACVCKPEYPGVYPDCREGACLNHPCKNGGNCTTTPGGYNCSCLPGYTGPACERVIGLCKSTLCRRKCDSRPCLHAISCQDYLGGYYCTCRNGWGGADCDMELESQCSSEPCSNGATCSDFIDFYTCHCVPGFTGKLCQSKVDVCASVTCLNGGRCAVADTSDAARCECPDEWTGSSCEQPRDICEALRPCRNDAVCVASPTNKHDFRCNCLPGFEGEHCELNAATVPSSTATAAASSSAPNSVVSTSDDLFDPCAREPCARGATCTLDRTTRETLCVCAPGFTGPRCEQDIDECKGKDKLCNNGICVNTIGGFQCYCQPGYTGVLCSLDFNECLSMPCKNNATCVNEINNFECLCPPGYAAKDCSLNIDECDPNPCLNGTCVDGINSYTCECESGFTGRNCSINIDDCVSSPCLNGAQCIDGLNSYTCNCSDTGYTGTHCQVNIDDCESNPCSNGAECIDDVKDYQCSCHPGYTGKNCDEDINECEGNPCQHDGLCLEKSNRTLYEPGFASVLNITMPEIFNTPFSYDRASGYECICVLGVEGSNCEIDINECASNPCREGECVDLIGSFKCDCHAGFEGEICQIDINECEKYSPCVHGQCHDRRASYYCACDKGYGGMNCSVELAGCNDNPCRNGGICTPHLQNETTHLFNCSCPPGFQGQTCEKITTMSLSGKSFVTVNTSREEGYDLQFRFKTTLGDGLLAMGNGVTLYILQLSKGRLNLQSSLLNKWEGVFIGSNLNDSHWQKVFVAINSTHVVLSANDEQTIYPITVNENNNNTITSFPLTYVGGTLENLRKLISRGQFFVGCIEDVQINHQWILPESNVGWTQYNGVEVGCLRTPQCDPNPCGAGGHCTDMWKDFSCTCERPHLGHTCQYNYTAATFGYENITDSLVTVNVTDSARRAVRTIVDISMFIKTRQSRGQIFYLGSALGSGNSLDETYIAAQLEGGELLVRMQFNGTPEAYTVGSVKLNNGNNHLIEVIRNVTLVQVKINGTEDFRKTISATGNLDAQVLFLGGQPQLRPVRQVDNTIKIDVIPPTASAVTTPLSNIHFKGVIQDVQISNGSSVMIVEFFPLEANDIEIPMSFGEVVFDKDAVLKGVLSDNMCVVNPCFKGGTCHNTWNDYRCECTTGLKGRNCTEVEFCQLVKCPRDFVCRNLEDGYECQSNATFDGTAEPLQYKYIQLENATRDLNVNTLELTYRTRSWGTLLFAKYVEDHFTIFIYHNEVVVEWRLNGVVESRRFRKDRFEGQWLNLYFTLNDKQFKGGFKDMFMDEVTNLEVIGFDFDRFNKIFANGTVYVAGSDEQTFDYRAAIDGADSNMTGYIPTDTTTILPMSNSLDFESYSQDFSLAKIDQNKPTDRYKGCVHEIRVGGYLLPLYSSEIPIHHNNFSRQYFQLSQSTIPDLLGCTLCYSPDCFNGGVCKAPNVTYQCNCTEGYASDDCSINIDDCLSSPCQNNGTCIDKVAHYDCQCQNGYTGDDCEQDIDECASGPCRHNGTCIDLVGTFKCDCIEGFVGKQCEAPLLITCESRACYHGATCKNGYNEITKNNFTCVCPPGMEGPLCDTPFCKMIDSRCKNGKCVMDSDGVPSCNCTNGFDGKLCENNIDDCTSPEGVGVCQHGGICTDGVDTFSCNCASTGYTGPLCEHDIDECQDRFACGQSNCTNLPGTYKCTCSVRGKCGHSCSLDDPCEVDNPCVHGECMATCTDKPDYICNCEQDYTGKNCADRKVAASRGGDGLNILYIVIPIVLIILIGFAIGMAVLVNIARSKRATRGTYSPSAQEFSNPRVELDHVLKPPPEERLI